MAALIAGSVTLVALASACGGSGKVVVEPVQETPDVEALPEWVAARISGGDGNVHGILFGTGDHGVGSNRVSFVVVRRNDSSIVQAPKADVYFGLKTSEKVVKAEARLVPLGPHTHPGRTKPAPHNHRDATDIYVTTVSFPEAGEYWFVVVFATPALCKSRVCGPTVDVVEKVRKRFAGKGLRFIHIEVYKDNRPAKGFSRWLREWRLPTEPWVFLVDGEGVIRAKFEGAVSVDEIEAAVRRHLL